MRLALVLEYEGTGYSGFQYQANAPSVQGELEKALEALTGERVRVKGAGRTDAGVHAFGQVAAFDTRAGYCPKTFLDALNYYLPEDIAVKAAYRVVGGFDPRREALSRRYRYTVLNSAVRSPLMRRVAHRVPQRLDVEAMRKAAECFVGEHDFARFAGPLGPGKAGTTVRRIYRAFVEADDLVVSLEVEGNAFLPHQVRRMAGALVDVGLGKLSQDELVEMIDARQTRAVAHALPSRGLCLLEVKYSNFPPKVGDRYDDERQAVPDKGLGPEAGMARG